MKEILISQCLKKARILIVYMIKDVNTNDKYGKRAD